MKSSKFYYITFVFLFFHIALFAQNFSKGPYLADQGKNSITIRWESNVRTDFIVKYDQNKSLDKSEKAVFVAEKGGGFLYEARMKNLKPGRNYYYQVNAGKAISPLSTFKTALSKNSPVSFVVLGDSRSKPPIFGAICEQINELNPDIILSIGDLVAQGGDYAQWGEFYFDVAKKVINHIPLISAVGDHEADEVDGDDAVLFTHFLFPDKDHQKLWFSFDYGAAHFVALDYRHPYDEEMIEWFKQDMASTKAKWKFVFTHRPTYNLGGHRSAWGKETWPELFRKFKVDIVFAGHSHIYERFYPARPSTQPNSLPVTYITTGGAGASLYEAVQHRLLACSKSVNHFIRVNLNGDHLALKTFLPDGAILDEASWSKNETGHDQNFLTLVKPQEELDIINIFEPISRSLERLPMKQIPAAPELNLKSIFINEDIDFEIFLAGESKENYEMKSVSSTLKKGETLQIPLEIYANKTMTVTKWGELTPALRLVVHYKSESFQGKVIGKALGYRAY